jgi:1-deoxy-D-xylulose-5-phosphate synthase
MTCRADKDVSPCKGASRAGSGALRHAKGKGYTSPAEPGKVPWRRAVLYRHGGRGKHAQKSNSSVFGETMVALAVKDPTIVAVWRQWHRHGTDRISGRFPDRFLDVASGRTCADDGGGLGVRRTQAGCRQSIRLSTARMIRFDDICLQNLPVVLAVDRAGLVGVEAKRTRASSMLRFCAVCRT